MSDDVNIKDGIIHQNLTARGCYPVYAKTATIAFVPEGYSSTQYLE